MTLLIDKRETKKQDKYLINWIGGKRLLRKVISELIPNDIGSYIEPFGGGAWVLFYKEKWANLEVYNDLDNDLFTLFTVVKYHPEEFAKELQWMYNSRALFQHTLASKPVTDIQRAAKFFYLIQRSYGAKGSHFATVRNGFASGGKSHLNVINRIWSAADKVCIENLDYLELIKKYDCDSAFFYLDPPYVQGADYYKTVEKTFNHKKLRDCLAKIKGRWLLSYDDTPEIRELYKKYTIIEVSRQNTLNNAVKGTFKELLIKNY
ncbi:MAG: DNA adenine methylase [Candidatus Gastranaerophilales bacterium]|nr:DNA adenine methylase [Candidatus Gastranaerophilales bacterium]